MYEKREILLFFLFFEPKRMKIRKSHIINYWKNKKNEVERKCLTRKSSASSGGWSESEDADAGILKEKNTSMCASATCIIHWKSDKFYSKPYEAVWCKINAGGWWFYCKHIMIWETYKFWEDSQPSHLIHHKDNILYLFLYSRMLLISHTIVICF